MRVSLAVLLLLCLALSGAKSRSGSSRSGSSRSGSSRSSRSSTSRSEAKSRSRASSSSSTSTSRRRSSSSSRRRYSVSSVLLVATVMPYSYNHYNRAPYKRYAEPELCMSCNMTASNTTCEALQTVCYQSSDCYTLSVTTANNTNLVTKGCLYDEIGTAGCNEKVEECEASGHLNCTCTFCEDKYCNSGTKLMVSVMTMVSAVVVGLFLRARG